MSSPGIRRLTLADIDEETLAALIEHGEDLLVERKQDLPEASKLAAEVGSFANMLGGWIVVGIEDKTGRIVGYEPPAGLDLQSHLGHLFRNELDPVPPYVVGTRDIGGKTVGLIRVFGSAETPVLVRATGAAYTRDAGGKHPIDDHRTLIELSRRGDQARQFARERLTSLPVVIRSLDPPDKPKEPRILEHPPSDPAALRGIVRAAPVTVLPHFSDWAISEVGANSLYGIAADRVPRGLGGEEPVLHTEPYGRGVTVWGDGGYPNQARWILVADSGGVVGVSHAISKMGGDMIDRASLRRDLIRPLVEAASQLLLDAEALGPAVVDLWVCFPEGLQIHRAERSISGNVHCSSELVIPAEEQERAELAKQFEREIGREAGMIDAFEVP